MKKNKHEVVDKLLAHIAQSFLFLEDKGLEMSIAWRMKNGTTTKSDLKAIKKAMDLLSNNPIYVK